jgi:hypothetical protein
MNAPQTFGPLVRNGKLKIEEYFLKIARNIESRGTSVIFSGKIFIYIY